MDNNDIFRYKYSPLKLQQLKMWLEDMKEQGQAKFFEVYVNDFKVVPKTENIDDLDRHEQYMDEETEKVTVLVYNTPKTNRYKEHIYQVREKTSGSGGQNKTLSGPEVDAKIEQAKKEWDSEQVKKEMQATKEKLGEAEEYIEKLKTIIYDTEKKLKEAKEQGDFTKILKDLAPQLLSLKKNSDGNLAGAKQETENPPAGRAGKPEEEASFRMKSSKEDNSLSEDEKNLVEFAKSLRENFSGEEVGMVLSIMDEFIKNKANIKPVAELLNININQTNNKNTK